MTKAFGGMLMGLLVCLGCSANEDMVAGDDPNDPPGGKADEPGRLLTPPPDGDGFQMQLEPFEIAPGEERYYCYTLAWPEEAAGGFDTDHIEAAFSQGVHHLLISTIDKEYEPGHGACNGDFGYDVPVSDYFTNNLRFLTGAQTPYSADPRTEVVLEPGMAFRVKPQSSLLLQIHWLNTTDEVMTAETALNVWYTQQEPDKLLESFFFYHSDIELPPRETTEVAGRCTFPEDIDVVGMVSHMHERGVNYTTHTHDGNSLGDMVYSESSWQDPTMKMWSSSDMLRMQAGTGLEYRCTFNNTTDQTIGEGDGANDEMCMLVGLYTGGSGGTIWGFPGVDFPGNACVDVE